MVPSHVRPRLATRISRSTLLRLPRSDRRICLDLLRSPGPSIASTRPLVEVNEAYYYLSAIDEQGLFLLISFGSTDQPGVERGGLLQSTYSFHYLVLLLHSKAPPLLCPLSLSALLLFWSSF